MLETERFAQQKRVGAVLFLFGSARRPPPSCSNGCVHSLGCFLNRMLFGKVVQWPISGLVTCPFLPLIVILVRGSRSLEQLRSEANHTKANTVEVWRLACSCKRLRREAWSLVGTWGTPDAPRTPHSKVNQRCALCGFSRSGGCYWEVRCGNGWAGQRFHNRLPALNSKNAGNSI